MVDPNAPSSTNPIYRYWLHWLIINNDDTIIPYNGPSPPKGSGNHRYFILLFYHKNKLNKNNIIKEIIERKKFNLMNFIQIYDLHLISYTKFNVIG
jgi:large subunit ribosomal protein L35